MDVNGVRSSWLTVETNASFSELSGVLFDQRTSCALDQEIEEHGAE
ncbi:MAG TPA: hypothetical protein VFT24_13305 [Vicinamibacterales bacterium]|nr:hypothetical protein [Vicinamibacterales bacterium]